MAKTVKQDVDGVNRGPAPWTLVSIKIPGNATAVAIVDGADYDTRIATATRVAESAIANGAAEVIMYDAYAKARWEHPNTKEQPSANTPGT